jgi:hypothetical protein
MGGGYDLAKEVVKGRSILPSDDHFSSTSTEETNITHQVSGIIFDTAVTIRRRGDRQRIA